MRIAYCGYDFFSACLETLLTSGFDVYRVFTVACDNRHNFNQYIYDIAKTHAVPVSEQRVDSHMIKTLHEEGCDALVTAAYHYKIPSLASTRIRGLNLHPTLLPVGRGIWPLPWTILTNQQESGVTAHKLTQDYDAGDIIAQRRISLTPHECLESLSAKVQILATDLLVEVVQNLDHYWNTAQPQAGRVSTWGFPSTAQRSLDWRKGVDELDRICRAFGKFGCYASFSHNDWIVYGLNAWGEKHHYDTGSVVHKTNTETIVAAADGLVSLLYFEPAPR